MKERGAVLVGAFIGAVTGGVLGYLFLTPRGRQLRQDLEPQLTELFAEVGRAKQAAVRARQAASEGWESLRHLDAAEPSPKSYFTSER